MRRRIVLLVAGLTFFGAAVWALESIPRGHREFAYHGGGHRTSGPGVHPMLYPLPFAPMNGFTPEQLSSHAARLLLAPACVFLGLALGPSLRRRRLPRATGPAAVLLGGLLVAVAAGFVLRGVPLQDDEPTYLMQASALAHGVLADPMQVPAAARWSEPFTIFTSAGVAGKYLFGEPLVLAAGMLAGVPLLFQWMLALLTLGFLWAAARRGGDREGFAGFATLLLALSPAFVFTSAAPLSQAPSLFGVAVAVWALPRRGLGAGVIAGCALGFSIAARPQVGLPSAVALALLSWRDWRAMIGMALGAVPWAAAVLAYDRTLTGDPLVLPWALTGQDVYGFGSDLGDGVTFGPWRAVVNAGVALARLNGWALGWPVSLAGPVAWLAMRMPRRDVVGPWAAVALAAFLFHLGYYSVGTSDTGAVYHHAALPFFALSTAAVVERLAQTRARAALAGIVVACLVVGTGSFLVEHGLRLRRLTDQLAEVTPDVRVAGPTLLLEEVRPAGRPRIGWLLGLPYRPRFADDPVVRYPRRSAESAAWLRQVWPARTCLYSWWDWNGHARRYVDCDNMAPIVQEIERSQAAGDWPLPDSLDGREPPPDDWQYAFPWLPI